jgi:hypothetical protein
MKTTYTLVLVGAALVSLVSAASAQVGDTSPWSTWNKPVSAPASKALDSNELGEMLAQLGYTAQRLEVPGGYVAFQITDTRGGVSSTHFIGIDTSFKTIVVCSGSSDGNLVYDPQQAGADALRKMLQFNNLRAPSYIFLNPNNAIGVMTTFGNSEITHAHLKSMLDTHLANYDAGFLPLLKEIASVPVAPSLPVDAFSVLGN